jgi:hypothetical protein
MGAHDFQYIKVGPPTKPGNNATVTLLDSTVTFSKAGLSAKGIGRVTMSFPGIDQASASGGLIGYTSPDKGTTWYPKTFAAVGSVSTLPATVAADTGADSSSFDIFVGTEEDVKFTYTAGATAPTLAKWAPILKFMVGNTHSGS